MLTLLASILVPAQVHNAKKIVRQTFKRSAKTTVLRRVKKCSHRARSFNMVKRQTADRKQMPRQSGKQIIPAAPDNSQTNDQSIRGTSGSSEIKRAGEFKGDLRDMPSTKPVKEYRPKLPDPKVNPKPYVKPMVIKQN